MNAEAAADRVSIAGEVLVRAEGLRKSYGPVQAVSELTFEVRRGEILGLLGANGAGKSTALRMLVGFQYPDAGKVTLSGFDSFQDGPQARASLGYLPESVPLYSDMEVRRYLEFFARVKRLGSARAEVDRVIELLDLKGVVGRPCGNISRGYRQRVGLAQAILGDPSILILDEPTSGLDPNQIHDFRKLLRELGRDRAILLSTHILPEAMDVCDRVMIMSRGRVAAQGIPGELAEEGAGLHWARLRLPSAPSPENARRFALERERPVVGDAGAGIYRVRSDLGPAESRVLLRLALERDWELLEWGAGSSALETVFRRLTLGEEEA